MDGTVLRVIADEYQVRAEDGQLWRCKVLGRVKKQVRRTSLIAAGDHVHIHPVDKQRHLAAIDHIYPRRTVLSRQRPGARHPYEDVILANPDQVMVVFAVAEPEPHLRMLDRFLVAAESSELDTFIVINKIDLTGEARARELFGLYETIGYRVFYTSARQGTGVEPLRQHLRNRITVVAGPSGVGKSSLINRIEPGLNLRVGRLRIIGKGKHTTRAAELHPLPGGGYIADTPGLRELGLWDARPAELSDYFPEIRRHASHCRFRDCTHITEPECAVRAALEAGHIHPQRWESYLRLFHGDE